MIRRYFANFPFIIYFLMFGCSVFGREESFIFHQQSSRKFIIPEGHRPIFEKLTIENNTSEKFSNIWVSVNGKDWSTRESFTSSVLSLHSNPDTIHKKIMTFWAFLRKNMYASNPPIANWSIHDPVFNMNIFGYGICDDYSHMMEGFVVDYLNLLPQNDARVRPLSGHVVPEFFYGGRWHSPDANICYYSSEGKEVLGVDELASGNYNDLMIDVLGEKKGKRLISIYTSKANNSIVQKWRNPFLKFNWTLYPGERIEYHRKNLGKYFNAIKHDQSPRYYSDGRIIFEPLKHFPQSLYKHENVILDGKNLTLKDKDQTGYIILQIQCPYIHVDADLRFEMDDPMDIESILLSCSRYRKKWDHLKVTRKNSTFFCDIGKQYKMDKRYSFCRTLYIKIEIKKDTKISDIMVDTVFQCSTVSLPELIDGENQITLKGHPKTGVSVKLEYELKEKQQLEQPSNITLDEEMKRITWEHKKVQNLSRFHIIISSDEGCLWPVQPYKTELDLPADSRSFDLKDIKRYLVEGEKYFFKISSIYQRDGEEHESISRIHPFVF